MVHQNGPTESIRELINRLNGQIWTSVTDMAASGTAVAEADITTTFSVPSKAKTLLGWRPIISGAGIAAAESIQNVFIIQGDNYNFGPQEVLGPNAPSILLDGVHLVSDSEWYPVNAPVTGSSLWRISQEPCDALAGNGYAGAEFTWTDVSFNGSVPVIRSKCSREVVVDSAGISAGTTLILDKVNKIVEVGAALMVGAHTLEEEVVADLILKCSSLRIQEIRCMLDPIQAALDGTTDNGAPLGHVSRRVVNITSDERLISVTADFDLNVDVTNAAAAVHMIRWV